MAQQAYSLWHGAQFRKFVGRRVVALPVIAAAAAALDTHGRAHSVAGVGAQQPATTPTAVWRFTRLAALMLLLAALVAAGACCSAALLYQRHWEHEHGATVEVSTFRVTGPQQAPGSCAVYGPLPPGYMAGCTIHKDSFGEVGACLGTWAG
jgi:hypothetical protein